MNMVPTGGKGTRRDRLIREREHNSYKPGAKPAEPAMCGDCGAHYHAGRWQWGPAPDDSKRVRCEACQRVADDYPAGIVRLSGGFARAHADEIRNLARNEETAEKGEHPLHRIMDIAADTGDLVIRTTDIHLPRRIGDAIHRAYSGDLDIHYDRDGSFVRAEWRRDD